MKGKREERKRRRRPYIRPIIVGFTAFYCMSMLLGTYIMKRKYEEEFERSLVRTGEYIMDFTDDIVKSEQYTKEGCVNYLCMLLSNLPYNGTQNRFQQISGAAYDQEGALVERSANAAGSGVSSVGQYEKLNYFFYDLQEYLSIEEMEELARYRWANYQAEENMEELPYSMSVAAAKDDGKGVLAEITVYDVTDRDTGDENYDPEDGDIVWQWTNAAEEQSLHERSKITGWGESFHFPYLQYGMDAWKRWMEDPYLQGLPEKTQNLYLNEGHFQGNDPKEKADLTFSITVGNTEEEEIYTLHLRTRAYPWLAAMDDMKYVYACMFVLAFACMIKCIAVTERTYKKREALEEMRRDFTNAVAHELKTPLGVIRGFAENLMENTVEEKREYYLERIIDQTEEMDHLVQEMIYISKLDSDQLHLNKEPVNIMETVKEQLGRMEEQIREKNISIRYEEDGEFLVNGDKGYLEKAIWNILANSVSYNREQGWILIRTGKEQLCVENSGNQIPSEDMPHLFEMFYTGEKSRSGRERHLGLGLYLTKKICDLHHLGIFVENTEEGVKVTVKKM